MSRKSGAGRPAGDPVVPSIPGSPDEALALAVRISRFSRDPDALMFDEAFSELAAREGGRLRDPRAAPGELTFGDLSFAASRLSPDEARELYRQAYWTPALCDHLPRAVALEVFDMAVSSGVDAALRALKAALRLADAGVTHFSVNLRRSIASAADARSFLEQLVEGLLPLTP